MLGHDVLIVNSKNMGRKEGVRHFESTGHDGDVQTMWRGYTSFERHTLHIMEGAEKTVNMEKRQNIDCE